MKTYKISAWPLLDTMLDHLRDPRLEGKEFPKTHEARDVLIKCTHISKDEVSLNVVFRGGAKLMVMKVGEEAWI